MRQPPPPRTRDVATRGGSYDDDGGGDGVGSTTSSLFIAPVANNDNVGTTTTTTTNTASSKKKENNGNDNNNKAASGRYFFPRTIRQEEYASLLRSSVASYDTPDIIVASGPAGTCKTLAATLVGVEKLMAGEVSRLVLTRPAVSADESLGFLPGSLEDKMHVWLLPILDVLRAGMKPRELERMMTSDAVEICSLSHMRGRTFHDSYVIVDECQNTTPAQMLMLMTRIGAGSRMVFTGDPMQHDRRPFSSSSSSASSFSGTHNNGSGLSDLLIRIRTAPRQGHEALTDGVRAAAASSPIIDHLPPANNNNNNVGGVIRVFELDAADIQRHRAISHVLALYDHDVRF